MTLIEEARAALAGASMTPDLQVSTIYLAIARSKVEAAKKDLAALDAIVTAREKALAGVDVRQLTLGGTPG